jgi:hypothetical protein
MKIEVCLGSQFQKAPQLNFAHNAPVRVASRQKRKPRLFAEKDFKSVTGSPERRYFIEYNIDMKNATTETHAVGT